MDHNKKMKRSNKYIAVFLALAVLANGVFASQMSVSMVNETIINIASSSTSTLPCHGEESANPNTGLSTSADSGCCDGDCNNCLLGFNITVKYPSSLVDIYQSVILVAIDNHKLSAHSSTLLRPPILI
jgi:hypothetical protein